METVQLELRAEGESARTITGIPGENLAQAIWLSGEVPPRPLCGGLGLCGLCRARFLDDAPPPSARDIRFFKEHELRSGWRLACAHATPSQPVALELPKESLRQAETKTRAQGRQTVWLGVDLGTTSLQWRAETDSGQIAEEGSRPNPQMGAGADIVSRIAYAATETGARKLAHLAQSALGDIMESSRQSGLYPRRACVAANSAMTAIMLGKDVSGLLSAPYALEYRGGEILDFFGVPTVIPPLVSPFIGGDISAGLIALSTAPRPFLLADLGTNAELALVGRNRAWFASAPLGPALEGIGPRCGQMAGAAVATGFRLSPTGLVARTAAAPYFEELDHLTGISGSGYLSLIALLLRFGLLTPDGFFARPDQVAMPIARRLAQNLDIENGEPILHLGPKLLLAASDVELLLKVRAAFRVALMTLLKTSGLQTGELDAIYLAGALGEHIAKEDLEITGFFPANALAKMRIAGNAALAGACMLARNPDFSTSLGPLFENAIILDLASDPLFIEGYANAMNWRSDAQPA